MSTDHVSTDHVSTDQAGTDHVSTDQAGTDQAGTDQAGTGRAGTGRAGTGRAGTGRAGTGEGVRVRDPGRRDKILQSAVELIARRGYHAVSLADIGAAAGIVGSGIYRHFTSKSAILVALLDQVMARLLDTAAGVVASGMDDTEVLAALVADQVAFAVHDRYLVRLYQREVHTLPEADRRRLRRLQRHYVEEWVHVLAGLRPGLTDGQARAIVHASIGAIQSGASYNSGLPPDRQQALLVSVAHACLRAPVAAR